MDAEQAAVTAEEAAALVAGSPFAERLAHGAPILVFTSGPPHLVYASPAALELFGANDLADLEALTLTAASPGARRLTSLALSGTGGAPRVESLRFYVDRRPLPLALLCGRVGDRLVVAAGPSADEIPASTFVPVAAPLVEPPRRFLWTLDHENRFVVEPALAAAFGSLAPWLGETLAAFTPAPASTATENLRAKSVGAAHFRGAANPMALGTGRPTAHRADVRRADFRSRP